MSLSVSDSVTCLCVSDDVTCLSVCQRSQADHNKKENQKLSDQLSFEKLERSSYEKMVRDMESLQRQAEEHEKTVEALQLACTVSTLLWLQFLWHEIISG